MTLSRWIRGSAFLAVWFAACANGQVSEKANERYQTPEGRASMARSLGSPGRDAEQKPKELVAEMALKPGMTVADIGAGPGYMLPYLSEAVGPSGSVLVEDIFQDFLDNARKKAEAAKITNAKFILGGEKDPKLPPDSVDVALVLDAYHHFEYPAPMLAGIRKALRENGRFVLVDYYRRPNAMGNGSAMKHIRLDKDDVIKEVEANGFHAVAQQDHIPDKQYLVVFEKQ
jgi:ubiquinone/menaquinone biosynthesis C-methylase UbiE